MKSRGKFSFSAHRSLIGTGEVAAVSLLHRFPLRSLESAHVCLKNTVHHYAAYQSANTCGRVCIFIKGGPLPRKKRKPREYYEYEKVA
jgi:hypothetical protein